MPLQHSLLLPHVCARLLQQTMSIAPIGVVHDVLVPKPQHSPLPAHATVTFLQVVPDDPLDEDPELELPELDDPELELPELDVPLLLAPLDDPAERHADATVESQFDDSKHDNCDSVSELQRPAHWLASDLHFDATLAHRDEQFAAGADPLELLAPELVLPLLPLLLLVVVVVLEQAAAKPPATSTPEKTHRPQPILVERRVVIMLPKSEE